MNAGVGAVGVYTCVPRLFGDLARGLSQGQSCYHSLKVLSEHKQPPVAWPRGVRVKDLPREGASPVIKWGQARLRSGYRS